MKREREQRGRRMGAVEERLLSLLIRRGDGDGLISAPMFQRLLGFLYLAGASIGSVSMVFPQPPGTSVPGLLVVFGVAYLVGFVLLAGRGRLPAWTGEVCLGFGTVLITAAIHFTQARTGVYSMFYVWVSISAFYFFRWTPAFLQLSLVGVMFAAVLVDESPPSPAEEWVITIGTVTVAGLFVGTLRRGVERLITDLAEAARTDHARLYSAERAARLEADRASESLRRLQQVTDVALSHLNLADLHAELLARVSEILGVEIAAVLLRDTATDDVVVTASRGLADSDRGVRVPIGGGFAGRVAKQRRTMTVTDPVEVAVLSPMLAERGAHSVMAAPLLVEGEMIGVLFVASREPRRFDEDEERLLGLVADRAALAIAHAQLYEREHGIAETLQRSLLPGSLPSVEGVRVAARYLPARAEAQVGGDWYDVVPLAGGGLALSIGDVSGHGVEAAALMGRLRDSLRSAALEGDDSARATERVDRLLQDQRTPGDAIATALIGRLGPGCKRFDWSSAGHPPALVVAPDGSVSFLEGALSTPLGVAENGHRPAASVELTPGSLIMLYTDGLVERRDAGLDEGLAHLARAAASADSDPEAFCDAVIAEMLGSDGPADDVAILAVKTPC